MWKADNSTFHPAYKSNTKDELKQKNENYARTLKNQDKINHRERVANKK